MLPYDKTKALLSQGNRTMQHVFPTPNDSLIVICFSQGRYSTGYDSHD